VYDIEILVSVDKVVPVKLPVTPAGNEPTTVQLYIVPGTEETGRYIKVSPEQIVLKVSVKVTVGDSFIVTLEVVMNPGQGGEAAMV